MRTVFFVVLFFFGEMCIYLNMGRAPIVPTYQYISLCISRVPSIPANLAPLARYRHQPQMNQPLWLWSLFVLQKHPETQSVLMTSKLTLKFNIHTKKTQLKGDMKFSCTHFKGILLKGKLHLTRTLVIWHSWRNYQVYDMCSTSITPCVHEIWVVDSFCLIAVYSVFFGL